MSNLWTISSDREKVSSSTESWETGGEQDLKEGAQVLKNQGKVFIIYSTRESWLKEYRLGQHFLPNTFLYQIEPENWEKSGPVFMEVNQVYGVGHASFVKSLDGKEDWILYHSKRSTKLKSY